jgi:hypothetical protein
VGHIPDDARAQLCGRCLSVNYYCGVLGNVGTVFAETHDCVIFGLWKDDNVGAEFFGET